MVEATKEFLDKLDAFIGSLTEQEQEQFAMFIRVFGDPECVAHYESLKKGK